MATRLSFTGDGSTDSFDLSFPYLSQDDVKATIDGTLVSFSWLTDARVRLSSVPPMGAAVVIFRETSTLDRLVNFQDGSVLGARDLNLADTQLFYRQQELSDLLIAAQQASDDLSSRAVRLPSGETSDPLPSRNGEGGKFVALDAGGNFVFASGTGADSALREDLADDGGSLLVRTVDGKTVEEALTAATSYLGKRASPEAAFNVIPSPPRVTATGLVFDETPVEYALRTKANTGLIEAVYVSPTGDDSTGLGSQTSPWRTIQKALEASTSTLIWAERGDYPPFNARGDYYPINFNRLRLIRAKGPINIAHAADDLKSNAVTGTGTVTFSGPASDGDTVTIGGIKITVKTSPANPPFDIAIGASATDQGAIFAAAVNLLAAILKVTASNASGAVTLTSSLAGTAGNATTLAKSGSAISVSGATLAGGRNTWTQGVGFAYKFYLTPANKPPRAVIDNSKVDPDTGMGTPLARYGNSRTYTFSGQPANGDTLTVNGLTYTFKTTAAGGRDVQIGASLSATLVNAAGVLNPESTASGILADVPTGTTLRVMAALGFTQTITSAVSGANLSVAAQVSGQTELENLSLNTSPLISPQPILADNGGWFYDSANNLLWVRIKTENIENYKANLELITADSGGFGDRCLVVNAMIALDGDISFRGSHLWALETGSGSRPEVYADFRHPYGRVTGFCTATNAGLLENTGGFMWINGHIGVASHIDTAHLTDGSLAPTTILTGGSSFLEGDPFTFPVLEFPNRNAVSAHSANSVTAVFGGRYGKGMGPVIAGPGKYWLVAVDVGPSRGVGNEIGIQAIPNSTIYVDGGASHDNKIADLSVLTGGVMKVFNHAYRTSSVVGGTLDLTWTPPVSP